MTTFFGRAGRYNVILDAIASADHSGSGGTGKKVEFRGKLHSPAPMGAYPTQAQLDAVFAERQRLLGLVDNNDEPVVPVYWDCEGQIISGFYRINDVSVNYSGPSALHGIFDFAISATQIEHFASPKFESALTGATISNPHGIVGESWFAFPQSVTEQHFAADNGLGCDSLVIRPSEDGNIWFTNCLDNYRGILNYFLTPDNYYLGSSRISIGDPLEVVVGSQIHSSPTQWQVSNGLVRIFSTATDGQFGLQWWKSDDTGWSDEKLFQLSGSPTIAGDIFQFNNLTILRNAPETCTIRLSGLPEYGQFVPSLYPSSISWGRIFIDLTIRIGSRIVNGHLTSDRRDDWQISRVDAEAATSVAGGIHATAFDADDVKYLLTSTGPFTTDLTQGTLIADETINPGDLLPSSFDFGIGGVVPGTAIELTYPADRHSSDQTHLIKQHFGGQSERRMVVSR